MKQVELRLTLEDNIIFTADAATEGGHVCLDYMPGSALHGAVASQFYANPELDQRTRYTLLHSGRVRFGDALPCIDEHIGWPMPLCWHYPKTGAFQRDGMLIREQISNFQWQKELSNEAQPKQMRNGYVSACGRYLEPAHEYALRTAIDADTGSAREAQLFGYDALRAGQVFCASLQWDEDIPGIESLLRECIGSELLLGRSRCAEFGRVRVQWQEASSVPTPLANEPGRLTLWLLSDLALSDEMGLPTLTPAPKHFGLDMGEIDWERSFLRTRRYAPYNAYRAVRDEDRTVITRGSVIHFTGVADEAIARIAPHDTACFGLYREQGLGRVWFNPPLLNTEHPTFSPYIAHPAQAIPRPAHPLLDWLEHQGVPPRVMTEEAKEKFANDLRNNIETARNLMGLAPDIPCGPSASQWGAVYSRAIACPADTVIHTWLFKTDHPVARAESRGWCDLCRIGSEQAESFLDWFKDEIRDKDHQSVALMAHKARECMQDTRRAREEKA